MADMVTRELEKLVRDRLTDMNVKEVRIKLDSDEFGDRAYRVIVVYEGKRGGLDPNKTSSLARYARHKLLALNESAFPFFRFVSERDAKTLAAA